MANVNVNVLRIAVISGLVVALLMPNTHATAASTWTGTSDVDALHEAFMRYEQISTEAPSASPGATVSVRVAVESIASVQDWLSRKRYPSSEIELRNALASPISRTVVSAVGHLFEKAPAETLLVRSTSVSGPEILVVFVIDLAACLISGSVALCTTAFLFAIVGYLQQFATICIPIAVSYYCCTYQLQAMNLYCYQTSRVPRAA